MMAGDHAAGHHDVAHVEAGDQSGNPEPDDTADHEEDRDAERDGAERPTLFVTEGVQVDGEAVERET